MTFIILGILIFCAHVFNAWFSRRRIPDVLLLMSIGLVIGPLLGWVTPGSLSSIGSVLASLTLLFILFETGTEMRLLTLRRYWVGVVQVTLLSFAISMVVASLISYFVVGLQMQSAIMLGSMVSGTAAAIVIPLINQMRVSERTRVTLTLESTISGMLSIVITLAFLEGYKVGNLSIDTTIGRVLASILMAIIVGLLGGVIWASAMERIRQLQNSMFLTPAFVFVLYGISESLGYSGAIASLAFGLVLGNPQYFEFRFLHRIKLGNMSTLMDSEKSFFKEFVFILKTYFFVYIGICIPFTEFWALVYGAIIAAALFVARFALIALVGRNNSAEDRLTVSMMIPKGLVAAVLAALPEQLNQAMGYTLIPHAAFIKHITYSVIFFSIIFCSLLVLATRRRLLKVPQEMEPAKPSQL